MDGSGAGLPGNGCVRRFTGLRFGVALLAILSALSPVPAHAQFLQGAEYPESTVSLGGPDDEVSPGSSFRIDLHFSIPEGWHSYWTNPGDGGAAAIIDWSLPDGFAAGESFWPLPRQYREGLNIIYGIEGEAIVSYPISVEQSLPDGLYTIAAEVEWLYCGPVCLPAFASVSMEISVGTRTAESPAAESLQGGYPAVDARVSRTTDGYEIRINSPDLADVSVDDLWFYPDEWGWLDQSSPQVWVRNGNDLTVTVSSGSVKPTQISGLIVAQDDGVPTLGFSVESSIEATGR